MPAINLVNLRTKLKILLQDLDKPEKFIAGLQDVYAFYSDPTLPLGSIHAKARAFPAYNTPPLLNREVEQVLSVYCQTAPDPLITILDLLWNCPQVELRHLAADLLGKFPVEQIEKVFQRISVWSGNQNDAAYLPYLFIHATEIIRRTDPQKWLQFLEPWKTSPLSWQVKLSLQGVAPLITDLSYANLPSVFTFLDSLFQSNDNLLYFELQNVLQLLRDRSEMETVYFLKQQIASSNSPSLGRLIRSTLNLFSPNMQDSLRKALQEHNDIA